MSASELRAKARKALEGNWGKGVLIGLCYLLIMSAISWVLSKLDVFGSIVDIIISAPISYGIVVSFMKLKRGEEVKYTEFLTEGFSKFGKVWGIYGYTVLKMLLPVILVIVFLLIIVFSGASMFYSYNMLENYSAIATFSGFTIIAIIGYVASIIYCAIKGLLYILTSYILYDNPEMTSKEIVEESEKLMRGNRGKYVWLELTFIGWLILSAFTFGIGLLWLVPYISVTIICFYEALAGKDSSEEPIEIEDNNPISE